MATNYNPANYALSDSVWKNIGDNDRQNNQEQQAQFWNSIGSLTKTGVDQYNQYKDNKLIKANTDEAGKFNQEGYLAELAKDNPQLAQQKRQQFLTQDLANAKLQQDIDLKKAQAAQAKALAEYNNARSHSEGAAAFINQLNIMRPSNQQEYDNIVAKAKSQGFPVDGFEGRTFTPSLVDDARKGLASYKDIADAAVKEKQLELNTLNQADSSRNIQSQIDYRAGQLKNQDSATNLNQDKFAEQKNQNQIVNQQNERRINIDDKQAQASISNMNIKNQTDALDRSDTIRQQQSVMSRMANTVNDMLSFPIDDYVGKQQTIASSEIAQKARSNTELQNFLNTVNNFNSQAFLDAIQAMKGMGALSNSEGDKLAAGYSALNVNSTPAEFKRQINIIYKKLNDGYNAAQGKIDNINKIYGTNYSAQSGTLPALGAVRQQNDMNGDPVIMAPTSLPNSSSNGMPPSPTSFNGISNERIQELINTGRY